MATDPDIVCEVTLRGLFRHLRVVFVVIALVLFLPLIAHFIAPADVGMSDVKIVLFAGLAAGTLLIVVGYLVYLLQRKRRITISVAERTVLFENFPVAESFFRTRVHARLLVAFSEVSQVDEIKTRGGVTLSVACPTGRLRVYPFMTNSDQLRSTLTDAASRNPEKEK